MQRKKSTTLSSAKFLYNKTYTRTYFKCLLMAKHSICTFCCIALRDPQISAAHEKQSPRINTEGFQPLKVILLLFWICSIQKIRVRRKIIIKRTANTWNEMKANNNNNDNKNVESHLAQAAVLQSGSLFYLPLFLFTIHSILHCIHN